MGDGYVCDNSVHPLPLPNPICFFYGYVTVCLERALALVPTLRKPVEWHTIVARTSFEATRDPWQDRVNLHARRMHLLLACTSRVFCCSEYVLPVSIALDGKQKISKGTRSPHRLSCNPLYRYHTHPRPPGHCGRYLHLCCNLMVELWLFLERN